MNTGSNNTYKELIMSGLYGVTVQLWTGSGNNTNGAWTEVHAGDTFCTGYNWGSDPHYENDQSYTDVGFKYGLTDTSGYNVRFQLQDGFTFAGGDTNSGGQADRPTVRLVNKNGVIQSASGGVAGATADLNVSGPDDDGWYYVTLPSPYGETAEEATAAGTTDAYLLEVRAYPKQYVVAYRDGVTAGSALNPQITSDMEASVSDMPNYYPDNGQADFPNVDNNAGSYYAVAAGDGSYSGGEASDSITVYSNADHPTPTLTQTAANAREITFLGWVLTDSAGNPYAWRDTNGDRDITIADEVTTGTATASDQYPIIQPSDLLELRNIMDASGPGFGTTSTEYALYLTALWSEPAPRFTYYVTFNYTDQAGNEHKRVQATVTRADSSGAEIKEEPTLFEDSTDEYYVVKRDSFFNLKGLSEELDSDGVSVVFDPANVKGISGGGPENWEWYKYDGTRNIENNGDPYKWTGIQDGSEVDVWYISTESQLTIGKTVTDLFPRETDPAETAANDAEFKFAVEFTLPEEDGDTPGHEPEYFGTGPYSVKYTVGGEEKTMNLTPGGDRKYTGELSLTKGQAATFTLLAGTKYTVTEQAYTPVKGIGFKPSLIVITNDGDQPHSDTDTDAGTASGEVALPGLVGDINGTHVAFTNTPSGAALVKAEAAEGHELDEARILHVGSGETVKYTITVYNYDVDADDLTITDNIPDAKAVEGEGENLPKLRVHETSIKGGTYEGEEGTSEQAPGNAYGGVVTWSGTPAVPGPGASNSIEFEVSVPIVRQELTYTNKATASWGDQSAESNEVTMTAYEDWLRIGKVALDGDGQLIAPDEVFAFTLTLTPPVDGSAAIDPTYNYVGRRALGYEGMGVDLPGGRTLTMTRGDGTSQTVTFELKAGQAITIYGIAPGIQYSVTETPVKGYKSPGMQGREGTTITDGVGTISSTSDDWVYFANTSTLGTLAVSKTVRNGPAGYADDAFTFAVSFTLPETGPDSTYFGADTYTVPYTVTGSTDEQTMPLTAADGRYTGTLTLKDGQTASFILPEGTTYTITEEDAEGYYNLSKTGDTGVITAGRTSTAAFVNAGFGSLTISKTVTGDLGETDRAWDFAVELSGVGAYEATDAEGYPIPFQGGVYSFQLKHGESLTIEGLPAVDYTVVEADANQDGYTTVSAGARGTIPAGGTASASFVNDRSPNTGGSSTSGPSTDGTGSGSGTGGGVPGTGDESGLALWAALASGGLLALAAILTLRRRKGHS